jgi:hypothetical protein
MDLDEMEGCEFAYMANGTSFLKGISDISKEADD